MYFKVFMVKSWASEPPFRRKGVFRGDNKEEMRK